MKSDISRAENWLNIRSEWSRTDPEFNSVVHFRRNFMMIGNCMLSQTETVPHCVCVCAMQRLCLCVLVGASISYTVSNSTFQSIRSGECFSSSFGHFVFLLLLLPFLLLLLHLQRTVYQMRGWTFKNIWTLLDKSSDSGCVGRHFRHFNKLLSHSFLWLCKCVRRFQYFEC